MKILATAVFMLTSLPALAAEESECAKLYNLTKSNPGVFAGLGRGSTAAVAADVARVDLAKEISSQVTATTKTSENNRTVSVESMVESKVSLVLVGAKVSRRCTQKGGVHEAVVTLPREILVGNLKTMLDNGDEKSQRYASRIREAKGQSKVDLLVEARRFLDESGFAEAHLLCRTYNGCAETPREGVKALQLLLDDKDNADLIAKASLYSVSYDNELSEEMGGEIKSLLEGDGVVASREAPAGHVVRIDCSEQIFPKVGNNQIIEINCRATGTVEGQKKFSYRYSARGVGPTAKDARVVARNQLEKVK